MLSEYAIILYVIFGFTAISVVAVKYIEKIAFQKDHIEVSPDEIVSMSEIAHLLRNNHTINLLLKNGKNTTSMIPNPSFGTP